MRRIRSFEIRRFDLSWPVLALALVLAGCSRPPVPEPDKPLEPQAATPAAGAQANPGAVAESLRRPIDRAEAAQAESDAAAERQREAIDAATGN